MGERLGPGGPARAVAFLRDVQQRFVEVGGAALSGNLTLTGFLSLFPLLVVGIAVLGFVARGEADLAERVVESLGLEGGAAELLTGAIDTAASSARAASVVGLVGLLAGGLGVVRAMQAVHAAVWQASWSGLRGQLAGIGWLLGSVVILAASGALTAALGVLPAGLAVLPLAGSLVTGVGLFMWMRVLVPNRLVGWRDALPGALAGAVGFEALKAVGAFYVPRLVSGSSALYGTLGVVLAVLGWLLFFSRLVVYVAVIDVVAWERRRGTELLLVAVPAGAGTGRGATAPGDRRATRSGARPAPRRPRRRPWQRAADGPPDPAGTT